MLTPGRGRGRRREGRRGVLPGRAPDAAASTSTSRDLPFVPGAEVAGHRALCARRLRASRPATASPRSRALGGMAEVAVAPAFMTFRAARAARLRAGRRADPQLPHRLLRAEAARPPGGGRARARPRRRRRRRHRRDPGREGPRRVDGGGRVERREGAGRARGRRGRGGALRRPMARAGGRADRRRRGRRARPRRRRPLHRQPALAARGRARRGGRLHRRLDPGGEGQPPAAAQHRGGGRRLGRLRDGRSRTSTARSARRSTA